jgi:hypothetical protein
MSEKLELVGIAEIARMVRARRQTVAQWRYRGLLPAPITELAMGPVWHKRDIEKWAKKFQPNFHA